MRIEKSSTGTNHSCEHENPIFRKEQIIKERKRSADLAAMPPPPPRRPPPAETGSTAGSLDGPLGSDPQPGSHNLKPPLWATVPVTGACLQVFKGTG